MCLHGNRVLSLSTVRGFTGNASQALPAFTTITLHRLVCKWAGQSHHLSGYALKALTAGNELLGGLEELAHMA
jgi:hypothetical protein